VHGGRYLELETTEFEMGTVMDAVVSQGMITSREKGLQLIRETPREIKNMCLFGDQVRLQQVLADFLLNAVRFTPSSEGWVGIKVVPTRKRLAGGIHVMQLEFRYMLHSLYSFGHVTKY
jgi:phytochrome B